MRRAMAEVALVALIGGAIAYGAVWLVMAVWL